MKYPNQQFDELGQNMGDTLDSVRRELISLAVPDFMGHGDVEKLMKQSHVLADVKKNIGLLTQEIQRLTIENQSLKAKRPGFIKRFFKGQNNK